MRAGLNDAGATREQVRRDQVEHVDYYSYFARLNERLLERQKSLWRAYYMVWLRSALYYDGKQILVPRSTGFGYDIKQLRGTDHPLYVYNKLRPKSDKVTSMWVQSSPEILLAALDEDDRKTEKALDEIELLNRYFDYIHFTEQNLIDTAQGAQYTGNYHFEIWFDPNADNGFEWAEEYAPLQMPESMWYECLDCGQMGEMPENGLCPHCGSQMVTPHMMPAVNVPDAVQTKGEWEKKGEIVVRPFPAWSMRYNLTTGGALSPWRYVEEDLPKESIEYTYGKLDPSASNESWGVEEEMHPERVMRRAERMRTGFDAEDDSDNVLSQRIWYEPEMLHYIAPKENVTLPDGEVIPAGERLSAVFPEGKCILTAPGLPRFLNVTRESHAERWVDGKYGVTLGKKIGHGIEDGVEHQRQRNILKSGVFRYLQKTLQPSIAVNGRVFKDSRLFNRVDGVININNGTLPDGTTVKDHFAYVTPPLVNPQIFEVEEQSDADLKEALKAFDAAGEYSGVPNVTATASKIGLAEIATSHNLHLALFAGARKEVTIRRLRLAQKNYKSLRLVATIDKLSGDRKVAVINSVSLQCQIIAWVKPGSFMPNLDLEKEAKFTGAVNAATALAAINMLNPASLNSINKRFQTDLTFERLNERVEECEETLDLMLEAFVQMQGMITPEELYMLNPVDPVANGHQAALLWWRDWLSSKEGRTAPEIIKEAVRIHVGQRYQALVMEQTYLAALANTGAVVAGVQAAGVQSLMPQEEGKPGGGKANGGKPPSNGASANPMTDNPMAADPMMAAPMMGGM